MTEAEWLACDDPRAMREFLGRRLSDRKRRLFECACCRRVWEQLPDPRSREVVIVAERHADGGATWDELDAVWTVAREVWPGQERPYVPGQPFQEYSRQFFPKPVTAAAYNIGIASEAWGGHPATGIPSDIIREAVRNSRAEGKAQAGILRCVFGNPFRSVAFDLRWRTETAVALASGIYEQRAFDRLPILADALEDAGCDVSELLNHLRGPGPHVRGCWAVDAVLGKQ